MGDREGDDGEGGNGVGQMGRGAMGWVRWGGEQCRGGNRKGETWKLANERGRRRGTRRGGISQMDRNAWVDIWNAWVERDFGVFLLCLPVQRWVPQLVMV